MKQVIKGIVRSIKTTKKSIATGVSNTANGIATGVSNTTNEIAHQVSSKKKAIVKQFKPKYAVEVTTYQVVPGIPVKRTATMHQFDKGERVEAITFYEKVVGKTKEIKLAPAEVKLIKGKSRIISEHSFGPITDIKKMRMSA